MAEQETHEKTISLQVELQQLRALRERRVLSLDDGLFVRSVVSEMDARIREIEEMLDADALGNNAT